jgi:hypothetical protein
MKLSEVIKQLAESYIDAGGDPAGLSLFLQDSIDVPLKVKQRQTAAGQEFRITTEDTTILITKRDNEDRDTEETY